MLLPRPRAWTVAMAGTAPMGAGARQAIVPFAGWQIARLWGPHGGSRGGAFVPWTLAWSPPGGAREKQEGARLHRGGPGTERAGVGTHTPLAPRRWACLFGSVIGAGRGWGRARMGRASQLGAGGVRAVLDRMGLYKDAARLARVCAMSTRHTPPPMTTSTPMTMPPGTPPDRLTAWCNAFSLLHSSLITPSPHLIP
jgi:hypothetical protein